MQDFPPQVSAYGSPASTLLPGPSGGPLRRRLPARDFSQPNTGSPARFLGWLLWQQFPLLALSALTAVLEWLPGSVGPYVVGKIVDDGITARDLDAVVRLSLVMLGLVLIGVGAGVANHTLVVRSWLIGMYGPMKLVAQKAAEMGHVLPQRTPTGEVLSVAASDTDEFGAMTEVASRFVGALAAYLVIVSLVLSTSFRLGLVVLVAAPMVVLLAVPLLKPLQRREEVERTRSSALTSLATDIVAGLRILRGIGGEQTFARNYAVKSQQTRSAGVSAGVWQAAVDSTSVLASGLFLVILTWLGAREVIAGQLTVGQLISFFGYAVFMVWPIQTFYEVAQKWVRCLVSARKTIAVLDQHPPWRERSDPLPLPSPRPCTTGGPVSPRCPVSSPWWSPPCPTTPRRSPSGWAAICPPTTNRSASTSRTGSRDARPGRRWPGSAPNGDGWRIGSAHSQSRAGASASARWTSPTLPCPRSESGSWSSTVPARSSRARCSRPSTRTIG